MFYIKKIKQSKKNNPSLSFSIMNLNEEWAKFIAEYSENLVIDDNESETSEASSDFSLAPPISDSEVPPCSDMYISTRSKIIFLNQTIDLKTVFWNIPVIPYGVASEGVIKKQMKFNSLTPEELADIQERVRDLDYVEQHIIRSINNPEGRVKFKDIRKISVGLCKKDLLTYRSKKKSAFYNCFVLIVRLLCKVSNVYKEHHVKIFNTGKVGVVGVQTIESFYEILNFVVRSMQPFVDKPLAFDENTSETILINSNFSTGFLINREVFYDILKKKYNVEAIYDPCSYPGIQCKYTYSKPRPNECPINVLVRNNEELKNKKSIKVSFMIFRTGSILIVGKCEELVLTIVYNFLKEVIAENFSRICQSTQMAPIDADPKKGKKKNSVITCDISFRKDSV